MLKKLLGKWLDIPTCPHCGSWNVRRGYFTRGWNHLCEQTAGDRGVQCPECLTITFDKTRKESLKITPCWCTFNGDPGELYRDSNKQFMIDTYGGTHV